MQTYRIRNASQRTANGRKIRSAIVFEEGQLYRWRIRTEGGFEFVDGGNYRDRDDAIQGLKDALDPQ